MLPLVLIPGIQGRCEYMRRTVEALSLRFHVVTFSLSGETMDDYVDQVSRALDDRKIERAIICGVSFGGFIALRFAANTPGRTVALVLASTPAPAWCLTRRHKLYARLPRLLGPLFMVETPWRLRSELVSALPDWRARWAFKRDALRTFLAAPLPLTAMAARARMIDRLDVGADCDRVTVPTLIVTGERELDRVVSASQSLEYVRLINGARGTVLERTGHVGTMTRPDAFAALVHNFLAESDLNLEDRRPERTHGSAPTPGRVA